MTLRELLDQVKVENIAGNQINPATEDTLDLIKSVLDTIDANTDELETKTQAIRNQLDVLLSTRLSETTGQSILNALGELSGTNIVTELQNLTIDTTGLATEATLLQVRDYLDTVEIKLQDIITNFDVLLSSRASESTVSEIRDTIGQESGSNVLLKLDELKSAIENIDIVVDEIEVNTDDLEEKVQSVRDQLDVLLSTRSAEITSQAILDTLGTISGTSVINELQNLILAVTGVATESTLNDIKNYLDTVETKLQTLIDTLDVNLSTRASEATLAEVRDTIGQESGSTILSKLDSLNNKDFATETTLDSVLSQLDITLSALRDAIKGANNKDLSTLEIDIEAILSKLDVSLSTRASENTLLSLLNTIGEVSGTTLLNELQSILSQLDVALSTRASENTLIQIRDYLDTVEVKLQTLINKDFSTEATSTAILNTIGEESGNTVLSKLQNIWDKLVSLFNDGIAKVKLWDGTNVANITADNKLKVDIAQTGYIAKSLSEIVDIAIPINTDYWILDINKEAIIDEIHIIMESDKFLFKINVDSTNYFDEKGADLKAQYLLDTSIGIQTKHIETSTGKDFHWSLPIYSRTSIQIGIRNNDENNKKLKGYIILYREKI